MYCTYDLLIYICCKKYQYVVSELKNQTGLSAGSRSRLTGKQISSLRNHTTSYRSDPSIGVLLFDLMLYIKFFLFWNYEARS
jgi:uncharacterized membrane protein